MKILVISSLFPPYYVGGYEIRCEQVSLTLAARGHKVDVLTSVSGIESPRTDPGEVTVHRRLALYSPFIDPVSRETLPFELDRARRWSVTKQNYATAREMILALRPDLVFAWSQARISLGAVRAAQESRLPVAWTFGDPNIRQYKPVPRAKFIRRPFGYVFDRSIWRKATWTGVDFSQAHCVSQDIKRRLLEEGLPVEAAKVIYRGIPVEKFPPRDDMGGLHSTARVLFVGQIHSYKGVHTLIEAAHGLTAKHGKDYLGVSIVGEGDGEYKREMARLAEAGATDVKFLGKVAHAELPAVYRDHDIFVFPSAGGGYEGFGATSLEAMASGLPVVGTIEGGQAELFVHEKNALVFEAERPDDLAANLERLIGDRALRERLAHTARKQIENDFTMEVYAERMERYLLDAVRM
ncbi:MAG: glycosyltransferase family 4 protein [Gammaproteobacteria bacterium]